MILVITTNTEHSTMREATKQEKWTIKKTAYLIQAVFFIVVSIVISISAR